MSRNILIVRTDRLGDVLLTTPLSGAIRQAFPNDRITWLVRPYAAPLLENNPDVDAVITDEGGSVSGLTKCLRDRHFDVAIVALPRWRIVSALWRARVPVRIGPASKWYSLFLNRRVWQHRSEGKKNEADYNLELLQRLGIPFQRFPTKLILLDQEREKAKRVLEGFRIDVRRPFALLHPGSGGSSARWPLSRFIELGDRLQRAGAQVLVTAGPGEDYQSIMIDQMHRIPAFLAGGSVTLREFAALMSWAGVVVTNSTGPLHMATALDVRTVSIFSAIPTCHPTRWGPYPAFAEEDRRRHQVFIAPDEGDAVRDMGKISVAEVWEACRQVLNLSDREEKLGGALTS